MDTSHHLQREVRCNKKRKTAVAMRWCKFRSERLLSDGKARDHMVCRILGGFLTEVGRFINQAIGGREEQKSGGLCGMMLSRIG